jgi:hypothetical protein
MILQFCMLYISFLWKPNENHAVIMLLKYVTFNMQTSTFANQCLSSLKLWVRILFIARCTRYNIMWQSLSVTWWFSPGTPVSSTNKTKIVLKVALNTITLSRLQLPNLYNILKIAELDCCQVIILSIYVPSTHAYTHVLRLSLDLPYEKR